MSPRPPGMARSPARDAGRLGLALAVLLSWPAVSRAQQPPDTDRIDITGRQNLTLGSGARAFGMGGAFLARADDATAASWNPAGLSYLRLPEVSLVGVYNNFSVDRATGAPTDPFTSDQFHGQSLDFGAFTWPVGSGDVRGAIQLSYQRAVSFDGTRHVQVFESGQTQPAIKDDITSSGGFDVVSLGTGLRLSRGWRVGVTVNRWLNGYEQRLSRTVLTERRSPLRDFTTDFRPSGWNFNLGLMWSPIEALNLGAVYKTPFTAKVSLDKSRADSWGTIGAIDEVTTNSYSSDDVRLDFPSSFGFGISWRPRDTLTFSADLTRTRWSQAQMINYFNVQKTGPTGEDGVPSPKPPPIKCDPVQYPTLAALPDTSGSCSPSPLDLQHDKQEIRTGVEWVLVTPTVKIPLRAGYFNDGQITPNPNGEIPHFNGFTAGLGLVVGSVLFDAAYVYEFGEYLVSADAASSGQTTGVSTPLPPVRNSLTTHRVFASISYRFGGRP